MSSSEESEGEDTHVVNTVGTSIDTPGIPSQDTGGSVIPPTGGLGNHAEPTHGTGTYRADATTGAGNHAEPVPAARSSGAVGNNQAEFSSASTIPYGVSHQAATSTGMPTLHLAPQQLTQQSQHFPTPQGSSHYQGPVQSGLHLSVPTAPGPTNTQSTLQSQPPQAGQNVLAPQLPPGFQQQQVPIYNAQGAPQLLPQQQQVAAPQYAPPQYGVMGPPQVVMHPNAPQQYGAMGPTAPPHYGAMGHPPAAMNPIQPQQYGAMGPPAPPQYGVMGPPQAAMNQVAPHPYGVMGHPQAPMPLVPSAQPGVMLPQLHPIPPPPQYANYFHNFNTGNNPQNTLAFHASPLDASVDDKLRDKILRGKYIDLAALLHDSPSESVLVTQLAEDGTPESQSLLVPSQKEKEKLTFNRWLKAFLMYTTVWCQQNLADYPHMLKYVDTIRELWSSGAKWYFYDEKFRRSREQTTWPWQSLQLELWGKAMAVFHDAERAVKPSQHKPAPMAHSSRSFPRGNSAREQSQPSSSRDHSHQTPQGYCYPFHRGASCSGGCGFSHICHKCDGKHSASVCAKGGQPKRPQHTHMPKSANANRRR